MNISEVKSRLLDNGIEIPSHTLRRKIDTYIYFPTRNQKNNRRDIQIEEFNRLLLALAIEYKTKLPKKEIELYLDGIKPKVELVKYFINNAKLDAFLQDWVEK